MTLHARIARIARQEFAQLYASVDDQADAMAAAILNGLREDGTLPVASPSAAWNLETGDLIAFVAVPPAAVDDPAGGHPPVLPAGSPQT